MRKIYAILSTFLLLSGISCTDFLAENSSVDVDKNKFMNNAKEAKIVLDGVYRSLVGEGLYSYNLSLVFDLTNDLSQCEGSATSNFREVPTNAFNKSNSQVAQTWRQLYEAIYNANDFMEGINAKKAGYSDTDKELAEIYIAEAKALRALFYFELVRWYGNVSLYLTTAEASKDVSLHTQAKPADVYAQIERDLKDAIEVLPWATESDRPFRMSKGSAYGLLTKVYATWAGYPVHDTSKWQEAANTAQTLITSGMHSLNPKYDQVWINTCNGKWEPNESLIEVSFYAATVTGNSALDPIGRIGKWNGVKATKEDASGGNAGNVKVVYTFIKKWQDQINADTLAQYPLDVRYGMSLADYVFAYDKDAEVVVKESLVSANPKPKQFQTWTPRKWSTEFVDRANILTNSDRSNINWYVLRYSDVLLLYAEALNELRGLGEASGMTAAYDAINQVRRRGHGQAVDAPCPGIDLDGLSYEDFQQAVRDERAYELCFEGHRRQDLIRWGIYYETIQEVAQKLDAWWEPDDKNPTPNYTARYYTVKGKHELFPIPQHDMDLMDNYKQNPKW